MDELRAYLGFDNVTLKADKKDKSIIYIEASNEDIDSDDEMVMMKALKDEKENYLKKGVISWDHQHKLKNNPKYIIGEPLDVRFTGNNRTLVKGRLYKKNEHAQGVLAMLESNTTRLGASIGGAILAKAKNFSSRLHRIVPVISRIKWDETAITYKPINDGTRGQCTFYPFKEFAKSFMFKSEGIKKALMAGAGVDTSKFTGGRALISESLGKQIAKRDFWVGILSGIKKGKIIDYKSLRKYMGHGTPERDVKTIATIVVANKHKLLERV